MNPKNIAIVVVGVLAALGVVGAVVLHVLRPDASATFVSQLIQILGLIAVATGLGVGVNKVAEEVRTVKHQTNGTLSALRDELEIRNREIQQLHREKAELALLVPPPTGPVPLPPPMTRAEARHRTDRSAP